MSFQKTREASFDMFLGNMEEGGREELHGAIAKGVMRLGRECGREEIKREDGARRGRGKHGKQAMKESRRREEVHIFS